MADKNVALKVHVISGEVMDFPNVLRWEYVEAHEGAHPAEWVIETQRDQDGHARTHLMADKIVAVSLHVTGISFTPYDHTPREQAAAE